MLIERLPNDDDLLVVWEVDAGGSGAGGVTKDEVAAEKTMLEVLGSFAEGRGRVRYARLVPAPRGGVYDYRYGSTLVTAYRRDGETVAVVGDEWEDTQ
ncbi:hypothetical protein DP939_23155 [Spongiactinospora rosea]|uniref:Uncharacterized protein n=1 Tax=Spongiactinospora rosea TaxID=2248750 RepID=A0A366LUZ0_9ACTN|nr:hypothetical protein [Spongiactinospora rosea]RBQ17766.1 hypothetical protein DP939_23155 [Spongiactinospora rosea]